MKRKKTIIFILPNILSGGAQRAIINLFNYYSSSNLIRAYLIIITNKTSSVGNLSNFIQNDNCIFLNHRNVRTSYFSIRSVVKKLKPDVVLSTLTYLNVYLLTCNLFLSIGSKLVIRETNTLSKKLGKQYSKSLLFYWHKFIYQRADKIIAQSHDMKIDLISLYKIKK